MIVTREPLSLYFSVLRLCSPRGVPPYQVIKSRIHGLIEREYLERDPNVPNQYSYLA